jgi:hypothetical protein
MLFIIQNNLVKEIAFMFKSQMTNKTGLTLIKSCEYYIFHN